MSLMYRWYTEQWAEPPWRHPSDGESPVLKPCVCHFVCHHLLKPEVTIFGRVGGAEDRPMTVWHLADVSCCRWKQLRPRWRVSEAKYHLNVPQKLSGDETGSVFPDVSMFVSAVKFNVLISASVGSVWPLETAPGGRWMNCSSWLGCGGFVLQANAAGVCCDVTIETTAVTLLLCKLFFQFLHEKTEKSDILFELVMIFRTWMKWRGWHNFI